MEALFEEAFELDSQEGFLERGKRAFPERPVEQLKKGVASNIKQLPNGKWSWKYDVRAMMELRQFERKYHDEYHHVIRSITAPMLIVRGAESKVMLRGDAEQLQSMIEGSKLVEVPGAKHSVMRENPVGYAVLVREYLKARGI